MDFTNTQIHHDTLPDIDDVVLKPISSQYIKVIIINKLLLYTVCFGFLILGKFMITKAGFQNNFWLIISIVFIFCVINFVLALLAFRKRKYAIREHDVIYAHGLIVNTITTVPISRIQHIEESRSWLSRQFHLATLNIYTAGESGSDLSIKGLPQHEARQVNDFISAKVNENN
ncbi:PH domain-containing protein [Psychroserpens sp. SPM9]|uniref:PH domain-containing protein n=1 Tax=Psychroserpens sp. SPM9 TaxID=2975598 RepID=UPI0021A7AB0A|nr:PH domain-containing protein [Psychroserpens sp. SPM9]MDG5491550.1 PH domain-containing protein [Psychroserpens sp. SPM9]